VKYGIEVEAGTVSQTNPQLETDNWDFHAISPKRKYRSEVDDACYL
jgi:hypothetical protein